MLEIELREFDLDDEDFDAVCEFGLEVQSSAETVADEGDDPLVLAVAHTAHALSSAAIDEEIEENVAAGAPPACAAGCAACCHIPVSVTAADVAALFVWLQTQPEAVRRDVETRVREALPRASGERPRGALPCPILDLDERTCRAYAVRPLACRGCFSDDAQLCEEGETLSAFVFPLVVARGATAGARVALAAAGENDSTRDLIVSLAELF